MVGAPMSWRYILIIKCHGTGVELSQPVETRTEGEAAEELISLISKSSHAGTEEKVLGCANSQNTADHQQPQHNILA